MHKKTLIVLVSLALLLCVFTAPELRAERATQQEMELVCQNWLSYMVYQRGAWAGDTRPRIVDVNEIVENDTVLGRCFSISPRGFVMVPILKELPPIQAYSDEYGLDVNQTVGFPQLLREFLLDRIRLYAKIYGSLDAVQPPTGDVLLGRGHKMEWNRFLKNQQEFETDLKEGKFKPLTEVGPLLTTSWHQRAPYNDLCPRGDTTCSICPSGKPPTIPTVVGCVATATAQILKYWNWPPSGTGTHSYTWYGDYSCNGSTPPQDLYADYSDPYDWQNMPDSCDTGCSSQDTTALAELCYEVGVAFEMSYGVCGSGAYTADALTVFPTYFRYDPSIYAEVRADHTAAEWFSIIQDEINHGRPMQYRILSHSIVCDGWRDIGGQNQYHMNYGWGGSFTTWFAIDSLYCYWVLPDSLCPPEEEFIIRNIMPLPPDSIPFAPAVNYQAGDGPYSVFCADLDGDGGLDLAVANMFSDNVSILKNNGDGIFQAKVDYATGDSPNCIFGGDLDADGDLDLAVANGHSNNVSILMNNGDATFYLDSNYVTGVNAYSIFCADLDGDCDLDIAVANHDAHSIAILKNNGDGTFQTPVNYSTQYPSSVFCADLDRDGDLDLAAGNGWNASVSIFLNNGDGTFPTPSAYATGLNPWSVFCADLDGDLDLDLAVANAGSDNVSILKNNGDGTFPTQVDYGAEDGPYSVFCADLDGDSDLDLAVANYQSHNVSILKNNGDGTFQTKVDYDAGSYPWPVFCADLDGDGDLDLAVANPNSDSVSILKNLTQMPGNSPPYPFPLLSPVDGDTTSSIVEFHWAKTQDVNLSDQIRYDLYIIHTSFGASSETDTTIHSDLVKNTLTDTLNVGRYSWKVKAKDNWGAETWSEQTWHFIYFIWGDANGDSVINVTDVVHLINYLFLIPPGSAPQPLDAGDANCDGIINVTDVVYLINYLFLVPPGPPPGC
jgi:hypothetical protein